MEESRHRTTRRSALGGAAVGAAGLATLAGVGEASGSPVQGESIRLEGRRWRLSSASAEGARTAQGELHAGGEQVGEFFASSLAPGESAGSELHTFSFPNGTILGMGAAPADPEAENAFAIVGGTGRYSGASGSYLLRQSPMELGGDGTAEVTMRLDPRGAAGGR
jgi:hypothetical protein